MHPRLYIRSSASAGRRLALLALIFVGVLVGTQLVQPLQASAHTADRAAAPDLAAIDRYIQSEMDAARVPGVAVALVQGERIVHLKGFGEADPSGRAVTAQSPFSIGSTTKSFTALAIMQLVEAGKVELDAPVQRYLPWFRVADREASARITVRHLLNHTNGLPKTAGVAAATVATTSDTASEDLVRSLRTVELTQPVGATWQYSNVGYATLGLLVQAVSGQSYERYVEEHIFAPLQMRRSFTTEAPARQAGLAAGYRYWFGQPIAGNEPFARGFLPAGYLMSSAEDLAHYLIAQLNGGRYGSATVLSPAGIAALQQGSVAVPESSGMGDDGARYGMGWFTFQHNGIAVVAHPGDTTNFHSDLILMPESRWGIVMLMNSNNRVTGERMRGIAYGVSSLLLGQQPAPAETNASGIDFRHIIGGLAAMQALALIWSAMTLRRYVRRTAAGVVGGRWSVARQIVAPLLLHLPLALVFLAGVPMLIGYPWALLLLLLPDVGSVALVAGVLALSWSVIRTGIVLAVLTRRSRASASAAPATREEFTRKAVSQR